MTTISNDVGQTMKFGTGIYAWHVVNNNILGLSHELIFNAEEGIYNKIFTSLYLGVGIKMSHPKEIDNCAFVICLRKKLLETAKEKALFQTEYVVFVPRTPKILTADRNTLECT